MAKHSSHGWKWSVSFGTVNSLVGNGEKMCISLMKNILIDLNLRINDLLLPNSHLWDMVKLEDLFFMHDRDYS